MDNSIPTKPTRRAWWPFTLGTWTALTVLGFIFGGLTLYPTQAIGTNFKNSTSVEVQGFGWPERFITRTTLKDLDNPGGPPVQSPTLGFHLQVLLADLLVIAGALALGALFAQSASIKRMPIPRIHLSTFMVLTFVAGGLLYLNMVTEPLTPEIVESNGLKYKGPELYRYGWPYVSVVQTHALDKRWEFNKALMFVDLMAAVGIVVGTIWVLEWRTRNGQREAMARKIES